MQERSEGPGGLTRREFGAIGALALGGLSTACGSSGPGGAPPVADRADVGFVLSHEQFGTRDLVDFARRAEQAGFGYLWASDHLQPWQHNEGHAAFPWLTLGLASQRTQHAVIGTGVTCPTYRHHPTDVAQAFATLAGLAPGRIFLGVGTGEAVNELAGTGRFGHYPERRDRLVEAISLILQLWSGRRVSFRGRYFQTEQLQLYDLPERPPPIYVAAGGPMSAAVAGGLGDGWITTGGSADPGLRDAFERAARAAGKDPAKMPIFVETFAVVGDQREVDEAARLWQFLAVPGSAHLLYQPNPETIGDVARKAPLSQASAKWVRGSDPEVHIAALRRLRDAGLTPFVHAAQADPRRLIDFYGERVLPELTR